jgi:hypothetical protein
LKVRAGLHTGRDRFGGASEVMVCFP